MTTYLLITRTVIITAMVLIFWSSAFAAPRADQRSGDATASASTGELGVVAVGAVEDTLKACLTRIPKDASIGQHMIAETSCYRGDGSESDPNCTRYRIRISLLT